MMCDRWTCKKWYMQAKCPGGESDDIEVTVGARDSVSGRTQWSGWVWICSPPQYILLS